MGCGQRQGWAWWLVAILAAWGVGGVVCAESQERPPNIVLIFIDDMGYADIGPFGAQGYTTPHLDRLAAEGMTLTDFVVSTAVCSASRAALLTGCCHRRVGISGALGPQSDVGIHAQETTLAEVCRQRGYATACFGKWHLGHHPKFLPLQHGFDEYFGLPYSNDMWPLHPEHAQLPPDADGNRPGFPRLPLLEGNRVVNREVTGEEQTQLTTWYTQRAVDFINRNAARPFFLYVPHSMVHVPLYVSDKFRGRSERGLFGDVVMEVDWSVGEILAAIRQHDLDEQTLVIFTSDNGPWLSYGDHAGSAYPFREGKITGFEGGMRVPTLIRWPGRIPAGSVCAQLASTIDILPTVAAVIGAPLPAHTIDGHDLRPLLFAEPGAVSPRQVHYCYGPGDELVAVRDGRWKLHFPHRYRTLAGQPGGTGGIPVPYSMATIGRELFDLEHDPGETVNVADRYPEVVARLEHCADVAREELGDTLTNQPGSAVRAPGRLDADDERLVW